MHKNNKHSKHGKNVRRYYDDSNTSSLSSGYRSDSLYRIRELCDRSNDPSTVDAIRQVCDEFDVQSDTNTSPSTIDAIRERCDDFYVSTRSINPNSRDGSSYSASTIDAIREICDKRSCHDYPRNNCPGNNCPRNNCSDYSYNECSPYDNYPYRQERYNGCGETFHSIVTPVTNLTPQYSGITGTVEFRMRRKNRTVTMQWEPFSGIMAASGVAFLTAPQSISNTPPYPVTWPIIIRYKDVNRQGNITVDPHSTNGNIRFYLNADGTGTDIAMGDSFYIYASSVTWLVN